MATKNFRSTVLEPTSEFAKGDKLRFTALATVGEVLKGSFSETTIGEDGVYSVDLQYGKHRIDYKPYEGVWRHFADVEVNADTLATTLQDLALASVPVTDETVLVLQGILADAEAAKTAAETAETAAETALASIDETIDDAKLGFPDLINAQLIREFYVSIAGSDEAGDGTSANPFAKIQKAIDSTAYTAHVTIRILNSGTKIDSHVVSSTLQIGARKVTIILDDQHLALSDSLGVLASGVSGCELHLGAYNGIAHIHAGTNKIILASTGRAALYIGMRSVSSCIFYVADAVRLTFLQSSSLGVRSVSDVSTYRVSIKNSDGTSDTVAQVRGCEMNIIGSTHICHRFSSLGANYKDFDSDANIATLVSSLKIVSV